MKIKNLAPHNAAPVRRENVTTISELTDAINASGLPGINCSPYRVGRGGILCNVTNRILRGLNPFASDNAE